MTDAAWIRDRLPAIERIERRSEPDYYGASWLIARQLGRKAAPRSFATWTHMWQLEPTTHVEQVLTVGNERVHLVATPAEADLLNRVGRARCAPVGLPFIYADHIAPERRRGSLLVMPAHTLNYAKYDWDQSGYVEQIAALRRHFSSIVACVQANCVEQGYWTQAFERHGIPWIAGAASDDANALIRMTTILKSFEYVTTNRIASHVAYAAYSGCKVSVYGQYVPPRWEHYTNHPFYMNRLDVLRLNIDRAQEEAVRQRYSQFFVAPHEATVQKRWADEALGAEYRKTPGAIARLLGWSAGRQAIGNIRLARDYTHRRAATIYRSVAKRLFSARRRAA